MSHEPDAIMREVYLGDGLYARFDGYAVWLRAPRLNGDHEVALEPEILMEFERYLAGLRLRLRALAGTAEERQSQ